MNMGYLALLVAEIPLWIKHMVTDGEIDFVTFKHFAAKNTSELLKHFEENMELAREALQGVSDEDLEAPFSLKLTGNFYILLQKCWILGLL